MPIGPTRRPAAAIASALRGLCGGAVHLPGSAGYDTARAVRNADIDQRPAAVAYPADPAEVAAVVRAAADAGLRVAPQRTGHNAGPLGALDDVVLLRTSAMNGVSVDASTLRARVRAGVLWIDVVEALAVHDLAALHGSSPDIGVVGYSLGGGIGWYARMLGLQSSNVTAVELVTADGTLVRADAHHDRDLFWALRGGGGNFGVVTALEFTLHPIRAAYAGMLAWDWRYAKRVLTRWADWAGSAPDSATTACRIMRMPVMPDIPRPLHGRRLVIIDGAVLAHEPRGAAALAPLRELRPEIDTFTAIPASALPGMRLAPHHPTSGSSDSAMLSELPPAGIDTLIEAVGPDSGSHPQVTELRHLGGALARPYPDAGALAFLDGRFLLVASGNGNSAATASGSWSSASPRQVVGAMAPFSNGRRFLNLVGYGVDAGTGYSADAWSRLRTVRAAVDPGGLFLANHPVPPVSVTNLGMSGTGTPVESGAGWKFSNPKR